MTNESKQPTLPEAIALVREFAEMAGEEFPITSQRVLAALDSLQVGEPIAWEDFNEWMHRGMPSGTIIGDPGWWASCIFQRFIKPADCPRCAELEAINRQLNREVISVGDEAEDYAMKLSATESERDKPIQAVADHMTIRAEQHQRIAALEAENARISAELEEAILIHQTDTGTESAVAALQDTIAQQAEQLAAAERDAERYRYLKTFDLCFAILHWNRPETPWLISAAPGWEELECDAADKAIDAAIAAKKASHAQP